MARRVTRLASMIAALTLAVGGCSADGPSARIAGPRLAELTLGQVPLLQEPEFGGATGTTTLGEEKLAEVAEATPEGLRITSVKISALSPAVSRALRFKGFKGGSRNALINLPIEGIDPQLGMYYLLVPVINEGKEPVRNLKARADFFDASGVRVWTETQPVTHFPTRLGLNPPSLPNTAILPEVTPLGSAISGFSLFYFAGNVGLFTYAVPDTAVAATVASWKLTFLVSTT